MWGVERPAKKTDPFKCHTKSISQSCPCIRNDLGNWRIKSFIVYFHVLYRIFTQKRYDKDNSKSFHLELLRKKEMKQCQKQLNGLSDS